LLIKKRREREYKPKEGRVTKKNNPRVEASKLVKE
jgi:hypothetical protein